jgi:hypothetical protein
MRYVISALLPSNEYFNEELNGHQCNPIFPRTDPSGSIDLGETVKP